MKRMAFAIYILLVIISVLSLLIGAVPFYTTIAMYATIALLLLKLVSVASKKGLLTSNQANIRLMIIALFTTLCVVDLLLLLVIRPGSYLMYNERKGDFSYYSDALRQRFFFINKNLPIGGKIGGWLYVNQPDYTRVYSSNEYRYTHQYNHEGFRGGDVAIKKALHEIRIITMGDSFTEGAGTPQDSTWPHLLQQQLQATTKDTSYTVINGGICGSDPFFELYLLKERLLKYKPDIVTVAVNNSDINDVAERGGYERFKPGNVVMMKSSPWWEPVYGASIICRMIVRNIFHYDYNLVSEKDEVTRRHEACRQIAEVLNDFYTLSQSQHFKLVVIFHPGLSELKTNIFQLDEVENMPGAQYYKIDLFREYQTYFASHHLNPANYFWPTDMHQNSAGYLIWSQIVSGKLMPLLKPGSTEKTVTPAAE